MAEQEIESLVAIWLAGDEDGLMHDACADNPERAWLAIGETLKRDLTDDEKALLAAGPLENLLVWHGAAFIDRVEEEARRNSRFNDLLGGVWRQSMPSEIWSRVEAARLRIW